TCAIVGGQGEKACVATCVGTTGEGMTAMTYVGACTVTGFGTNATDAFRAAKALCGPELFKGRVVTYPALAIEFSIGWKDVGPTRIKGSFVNDAVEANPENCLVD